MNPTKTKIGIIGAGAAGYFAAINTALNFPDSTVTILEKSSKVLTKVSVSGGGRCNVTNVEHRPSVLAKQYPRGGNFLKKRFGQFSSNNTIDWFANRGVNLIAEEDGRMFPDTNVSATIINCFESEINRLGIEVRTNTEVIKIQPKDNGFEVESNENDLFYFDRIIATSGGGQKEKQYQYLTNLGHQLRPLIPSLFTFNLKDKAITNLSGLSVANVSARIQGLKTKSEGPILITHWGLSGPAILKLSAFEAESLFENNYSFTAQINWLQNKSEEDARQALKSLLQGSKKTIKNCNEFGLPTRLFEYLLEKSGIPLGKKAAELSKKEQNKFLNVLVNDCYAVEGKTTFKEEFVTCGGIPLEEVQGKTMESNHCPGLFFAGEVLDIDGVTGGYNFQAAWTTAYIAAQHVGIKQ